MNYYVPTRPYSIVDSLNRMSAALGSCATAQASAHANYNGHSVKVRYNEYRKYYTAEYTWSGRVVLARGDFDTCLNAALREYDFGALGATVIVDLEDSDPANEVCSNHPRLVAGKEEMPTWYTWKHSVAASCAKDYANRSPLSMIFDLPLLEAVDSESAYIGALRKKYGRSFR